MVEDDLLAEIYLERENEYTLAGSIYKGRVTRVLPGMQSAFVDIGLERDAFLYVSDFMELEDSEDLDDVPTNRPAQERHQPQAHPEAHNGDALAAPVETESQPARTSPKLEPRIAKPPAPGESRDNRGGMRGRRRRRGRRGERMPESKFASPATRAWRLRRAMSARTDRASGTNRPSANVMTARQVDLNLPIEVDDPSVHARTDRPERSEYGPPPGYQPIILPGESISKYSRMATTPGRHQPANGLRLRLKSGLRNRLQKFLPTMNLSLRRPLLAFCVAPEAPAGGPRRAFARCTRTSD